MINSIIKKIQTFDRPYMFVFKLACLFLGACIPFSVAQYSKQLNRVDSVIGATNGLCENFKAPSLDGFVDIRADDGKGHLTASDWVDGKLNIMIAHDSTRLRHTPEGSFVVFNRLISSLYPGDVVFHALSIHKTNKELTKLRDYYNFKSHWTSSNSASQRWIKAISKSRTDCSYKWKPNHTSGTVIVRSPEGKFYIGHIPETSGDDIDAFGEVASYHNFNGIVDPNDAPPLRPLNEGNPRAANNQTTVHALDIVSLMKAEGHYLANLYPLDGIQDHMKNMEPYHSSRVDNEMMDEIIKPILRINKTAWNNVQGGLFSEIKKRTQKSP